jgi:hypothetical protein
VRRERGRDSAIEGERERIGKRGSREERRRGASPHRQGGGGAVGSQEHDTHGREEEDKGIFAHSPCPFLFS